jgi:hypothetical protein
MLILWFEKKFRIGTKIKNQLKIKTRNQPLARTGPTPEPTPKPVSDRFKFFNFLRFIYFHFYFLIGVNMLLV